MARLAEVRDLRLLVHRPAHAVADEAADHGKALLFGGCLDRVRDVGEPVADTALLDSGGERGAAGLEQPLGLRRDLADRERVRGVGHETVERDADVDGQQVALLERVRPRDPVDDHVVRRRADRRRVAAVALERGRPALRADELLRDRVELLRGDAGASALTEQREHVGDHDASAGHPLDLLRGLADDHLTAACSNAF